jgi:hypothetical protein
MGRDLEDPIPSALMWGLDVYMAILCTAFIRFAFQRSNQAGYLHPSGIAHWRGTIFAHTVLVVAGALIMLEWRERYGMPRLGTRSPLSSVPVSRLTSAAPRRSFARFARSLTDPSPSMSGQHPGSESEIASGYCMGIRLTIIRVGTGAVNKR